MQIKLHFGQIHLNLVQSINLRIQHEARIGCFLIINTCRGRRQFKGAYTATNSKIGSVNLDHGMGVEKN